MTLPASDAAPTLDPGVRIGHVHLKVADLDRALGFYCGVLGFELMQRFGSQAAFISRRRLPPPYRPQHLGESRRQPAGERHDRPVPHGHPLPDARGPRRCAAAPHRGRDPARWGVRPRRERGALPARPRPERRGTLLGPPPRRLAGGRPRRARHVHRRPRSAGLAGRLRASVHRPGTPLRRCRDLVGEHLHDVRQVVARRRHRRTIGTVCHSAPFRRVKRHAHSCGKVSRANRGNRMTLPGRHLHRPLPWVTLEARLPTPPRRGRASVGAAGEAASPRSNRLGRRPSALPLRRAASNYIRHAAARRGNERRCTRQSPSRPCRVCASMRSLTPATLRRSMLNRSVPDCSAISTSTPQLLVTCRMISRDGQPTSNRSPRWSRSARGTWVVSR